MKKIIITLVLLATCSACGGRNVNTNLDVKGKQSTKIVKEKSENLTRDIYKFDKIYKQHEDDYKAILRGEETVPKPKVEYVYPDNYEDIPDNRVLPRNR